MVDHAPDPVPALKPLDVAAADEVIFVTIVSVVRAEYLGNQAASRQTLPQPMVAGKVRLGVGNVAVELDGDVANRVHRDIDDVYELQRSIAEVLCGALEWRMDDRRLGPKYAVEKGAVASIDCATVILDAVCDLSSCEQIVQRQETRAISHDPHLPGFLPLLITCTN